MEVLKKNGYELKNKQLEMIENLNVCLSNFRNALVYGCPYSGKSTVIKICLEYMRKNFKDEEKIFNVIKILILFLIHHRSII